MNGVSIKYGGVAIGAKENFDLSASEKTGFSNLSSFKEENTNISYSNPCEEFSVLLDGSAVAFPSDEDEGAFGYWSEQLSGEDGVFEDPIILEFVSPNYFSSNGITLTFDTTNIVYPRNINVKWYNDSEIIEDSNFEPNDARYFCNKKVNFYNKIVITVYSMILPKNRFKLQSIDYGLVEEWGADQLRRVKIIQEIDPSSSKLPINTCDFTFSSNSDTDYAFQERQSLRVYFNGSLKSTVFLKSSKRKAKNIWDIQAEDYIGILETIPFKGGIYSNYSAKTLIEEIFSTANVPYHLPEDFTDKKLSGHIPYTNCREALMQVVFAIGAVADTSGSDYVDVYYLSNETTQSIGLERIMRGQNFDNDTRVTAVEVFYHSYKPISDRIDVYDATESGYGDNILVIFSEPLQKDSLSITNGGSIVERGSNYAIINATSTSILSGAKYEHTKSIKTQKNPLVLTTDIENIVSIQKATLVSSDNSSDVLERCYNYFVNTEKINLKIVEGKRRVNSYSYYGEKLYGSFVYGYSEIHQDGVEQDRPTNVGEMIDCDTEYLGKMTGKRIIKQTYNLNGGIIIKDTVLK